MKIIIRTKIYLRNNIFSHNKKIKHMESFKFLDISKNDQIISNINNSFGINIFRQTDDYRMINIFLVTIDYIFSPEINLLYEKLIEISKCIIFIHSNFFRRSKRFKKFWCKNEYHGSSKNQVYTVLSKCWNLIIIYKKNPGFLKLIFLLAFFHNELKLSQIYFDNYETIFNEIINDPKSFFILVLYICIPCFKINFKKEIIKIFSHTKKFANLIQSIRNFESLWAYKNIFTAANYEQFLVQNLIKRIDYPNYNELELHHKNLVAAYNRVKNTLTSCFNTDVLFFCAIQDSLKKILMKEQKINNLPDRKNETKIISTITINVNNSRFITENSSIDYNKCNTETILCYCQLNKNDLDMILCEKCLNWLHTTCCGFFSNNDKRIPENFICIFCSIVSKKFIKNEMFRYKKTCNYYCNSKKIINNIKNLYSKKTKKNILYLQPHFFIKNRKETKLDRSLSCKINQNMRYIMHRNLIFKNKFLAKLKIIANYRRALSIIHSEKINSPELLSLRMGISMPFAHNLFENFVRKGFLEKKLFKSYINKRIMLSKLRQEFCYFVISNDNQDQISNKNAPKKIDNLRFLARLFSKKYFKSTFIGKKNFISGYRKHVLEEKYNTKNTYKYNIVKSYIIKNKIKEYFDPHLDYYKIMNHVHK
ncbi:hypothetical protein EDEG_03375 [Edhazardia aedis USNM 41457]|uniref:Zinc finger PHD-type domain-containing protein n=1 Tax=Edhazardia aedis (strain USNM 41457) TaxID=1003232 RepID=J9D3R2_EDHAE|nr:hypothetical protein EDEG_03375 [Edhazardia aedis USNM 41457]|eukprot:EJW02179.1 hypothetical protein EDEG_03375 [Edhazardia aedis USNM 41457]